jgi:hypothetical protein
MWMTYAEAAERMGSTPEAVRQQARRGKWGKQRPNHGGQPARIDVPDDVLSASRPALVRPDAAPAEPDNAVADTLRAHVTDLQTYMTVLQEQLAQAREREGRDGALITSLGDQVKTLQANLDALRVKLEAAEKRRWWQRLLR